MVKDKDFILKSLDKLILHLFPKVKIIEHDAKQARKQNEEFGFNSYITLTNKGTKKEGEEIHGKLPESSIEAQTEYQDLLINYLKSQDCENGRKTLIWRKRPFLETLFDREGYIIYSRLAVK